MIISFTLTRVGTEQKACGKNRGFGTPVSSRSIPRSIPRNSPRSNQLFIGCYALSMTSSNYKRLLATLVFHKMLNLLGTINRKVTQ